ncbi:hypothetical protein EUX98_g7741 [Antrodiella citrinella]|uniref:Uncharacterized protein n=1 Tax=Antrodiella citrinella TaxID=2447956 RepID=A0A4S4MN40_9APHY|nr:hypothetical protein EUX98_g7741 [Antrodiella citrinella]
MIRLSARQGAKRVAKVAAAAKEQATKAAGVFKKQAANLAKAGTRHAARDASKASGSSAGTPEATGPASVQAAAVLQPWQASGSETVAGKRMRQEMEDADAVAIEVCSLDFDFAHAGQNIFANGQDGSPPADLEEVHGTNARRVNSGAESHVARLEAAVRSLFGWADAQFKAAKDMLDPLPPHPLPQSTPSLMPAPIEPMPGIDSSPNGPPKKKRKRRSKKEKEERKVWVASKIDSARQAALEADDNENQRLPFDLRPMPPERRDKLFDRLFEVKTNLTAASLPHQSTGFLSSLKQADPAVGVTGPAGGRVLNGTLPDDVHPRVRELVFEEGYTYVCLGNDNNPVCLTDKKGIVYGVRASRPGGLYNSFVAEATRLADHLGALMKLPDRVYKSHSRGDFPCVSFGVSHSRNEPGELVVHFSEINEPLLREFAASPAVQALVKHVVVSFEVWYPRLARVYSLTQRMFHATQAVVNSFFPGCPFAAQSLNLAEQCLATKHVDLMNLVFGVCCILPFGTFNPRTSAQVVLIEPQVIIELGPGDLFFFPSASIHHESIPLAHGDELRKSMIFYSAGGLFRWVKQGFQAAPDSQTASEKRAAAVEGEIRWDDGWKLFSNIDEFRVRHSE